MHHTACHKTVTAGMSSAVLDDRGWLLPGVRSIKAVVHDEPPPFTVESLFQISQLFAVMHRRQGNISRKISNGMGASTNQLKHPYTFLTLVLLLLLCMLELLLVVYTVLSSLIYFQQAPTCSFRMNNMISSNRSSVISFMNTSERDQQTLTTVPDLGSMMRIFLSLHETTNSDPL